jgi:hypothetical protein
MPTTSVREPELRLEYLLPSVRTDDGERERERFIYSHVVILSVKHSK